MQLFGFILLVSGTLVYNEIVIVPFCGFDKNTKVALEKKRKYLSEPYGKNSSPPDDKSNYIPISPHAVYDSNRNLRAMSKKDREHDE